MKEDQVRDIAREEAGRMSILVFIVFAFVCLSFWTAEKKAKELEDKIKALQEQVGKVQP